MVCVGTVKSVSMLCNGTVCCWGTVKSENVLWKGMVCSGCTASHLSPSELCVYSGSFHLYIKRVRLTGGERQTDRQTETKTDGQIETETETDR